MEDMFLSESEERALERIELSLLGQELLALFSNWNLDEIEDFMTEIQQAKKNLD